MDAENAQELVEHWQEWKIDLVFQALVEEMSPQFAGQLLNEGGGTAGAAERVAALPPEIQEAMALSGNAAAQMSQARQVAGNSRRPGQVQQPSDREVGP